MSTGTKSDRKLISRGGARFLAAFTLRPKGEAGREWVTLIDGQAAITSKAAGDFSMSFVRDADGRRKTGAPGFAGKHHGLSGPIDDF